MHSDGQKFETFSKLTQCNNIVSSIRANYCTCARTKSFSNYVEHVHVDKVLLRKVSKNDASTSLILDWWVLMYYLINTFSQGTKH